MTGIIFYNHRGSIACKSSHLDSSSYAYDLLRYRDTCSCRHLHVWYDDYLLDIILHQYKTTLYMNYAHFELIFSIK